MLCIIITISILSVLCVEGLEPETGSPSNIAISTQSYHRGDVPLSYTITSYHDYTTIRPKNRVPIYAVNNHVPQYTPLYTQPPHTQPPYTQPVYNLQKTQPFPQSPYKEQLKLSLLNQHQYQIIENAFQKSREKSTRNNLEPRLVVKHGQFQNEKYKSFVPGHNVAVAPRFKHKSPILTDLYENYKKQVQTDKIIVPKHASHEKQKHPLLVQTQVIKTESESTHLQNAGFPVIPKENFPTNTHVITQNAHEHKEVLFPQLPAPRAPRLHLNIARVYGIAHIPHQAPEPPNNREKPLTHTQAIIVPHPETSQDKTLLYPINNFQRYPIHVV